MASGGSSLKYRFNRGQVAGVDLFDAAKRGNLGSGKSRVQKVVSISEPRTFPNPS
jgi:hypothetical protein